MWTVSKMHETVDRLDSLLLGPAPCDECRFRERCGVHLLACEAYRLFVRDFDAHWDLVPRAPTRARYLTIFSDKAEEPRGPQLRWLSHTHA